MTLDTRIASALERIADLLAQHTPPYPPACDFAVVTAARWRARGDVRFLQGVAHPHAIPIDAMVGVERQTALLDQNTAQFVHQRPANNVLLTGSRGTGKSSLVKVMLAKYAAQGLRLIEVDKDHLGDLPDIVEQVERLPYQFVVFCDDLSFDAGEPGYKALKAILDGSVSAASPNVLIYATSNRRHLLPEYMQENLETKYKGEEIHPGESVEEKISLSERFGLWLSFYPFSQDEYLAAVMNWLATLGVRSITMDEALQHEAVQWSLQRGSRSGRVAYQFAKDYAGRHPASAA
jgi:uncharacterized protein